MAESPSGFSAYSKVVKRYSSEVGEGKQPPASNGRFFDVTECWVSQDEPGECIPTDQAPKLMSLARSRYSENSLLLRRIVIPQQAPRLQLEIQSASLQQVFRSITGDLASINVHENPIVITAPFHELYHFRSELNAAWKAETTDSLKRELQLFRDFEEEFIAPTANLRGVENLKKHGTIKFEYLWALFKPHELVVLQTPTAGSSSIMFCAVFQKFWIDTEERKWLIKVRHLDFNGRRFGPVEKTYKFSPFAGVVNIDTLPAYPLSYCSSEATVRATIEERSRKFIKLCEGDEGSSADRGCLRDYTGPVWVQREKRDPEGTGFFDNPEETITGRVLVDPAGFVEENHMFRERITSGTLRSGSKPKEPLNPGQDILFDPKSLDRDESICFPARIAGYSLATKHSGYFLVEGFRDVAWEIEEAKRLFDSSSKMKAIHNIISGFSYKSHSFGYSIGGKGRGLVFLFFGPSGAGKTLTAECIAEHLRRPLYRVSGADLGSMTREIERNLQAAFNRIARWEAILLLDEADAFMAERSDDSLERNALVTILLRLLEYQPGVIILTTNREKNFDKAFHSRIHCKIGFPFLGRAEREAIWRSQVATKWANAKSTSLSDADFVALSTLELDGRSIKNVFHVAELYSKASRGDADGMSLEDVKAVLQISLGDVSDQLKKQLGEFCGRPKLS